MRIMKGALAIFATFLSCFHGVNCDNVVETASNDDNLSTLATLIGQAGFDLAETLSGEGPFFVFAPTNAAFEMLPAGLLDYLNANPDELHRTLMYHVLSGGNVVYPEETDIQVDNGVIRVIETVMIPPLVRAAYELASYTIVDTADAEPDFATLVELLQRANLVDTLSGDGPFTVFAPTNEAFATLDQNTLAYLADPDHVDTLQEVLTYHVVNERLTSDALNSGYFDTVEGSSIDIAVDETRATVNGVDITATDILSINGVIHVISNVLVPPNFPPDDLSIQVALTDDTSSKTIVENVAETSIFSTLAGLVVNSGLGNFLSSNGPYTVFVPTNDAFLALEPGVLDYLRDGSNVRILQEVLKYHVVSGEVLSTQLSNGNVPTVEGSDLTISVADPANPTVNGYDILAADVDASNGVIHVVSNVLIPPDLLPANNVCSFNGVSYLNGDWAVGPTFVCLCMDGQLTRCAGTMRTTCAVECSIDDPSSCGGGACTACDPDTSVCVPDISRRQRNLRDLNNLE